MQEKIWIAIISVVAIVLVIVGAFYYRSNFLPVGNEIKTENSTSTAKQQQLPPGRIEGSVSASTKDITIYSADGQMPLLNSAVKNGVFTVILPPGEYSYYTNENGGVKLNKFTVIPESTSTLNISGEPALKP